MISAKILSQIELSKTVSLDSTLSEYPILCISNSVCSGKIALHGAHVFEWQPEGAKPVIYNSPDTIYKEGKAIRGGIPICWPWFNAHPTDQSMPSHGIARNRFWMLEEIQETEDSTELLFSLESNDATEAIWPYSFRVEAKITLSTSLKVELTTINTGDIPLTIGGALHTYLSVGDINSVAVSGLDSISYIDTVGPEAIRLQEGSITVSEEVDRIYTQTGGEIIVSDPTWDRSIKISRSGSQTAIVWNPWAEKAAQLGDLPNEAYKDFICIEAANARADIYTLEKKGDAHTLATIISL